MPQGSELLEELQILLHEEKERHVYHVTYAKHLPGIAERGLQPGRGQAMGRGGGTEAHSTKRVFMTGPEGVGFWHDRAEAHGNDLSDHPKETGHTPVVLRIKRQKGDRVTKDPLGSADASHPAFHSKTGHSPEHIEVFHSDKWHPIQDHEKLSMGAAYDEHGYLKAKHENPLHPKDEHLGLKR